MLAAEGTEPLGGVGNETTAADVPLPLSRRRRGIQRIAIRAILLAGVAMLLVAMLSPGEALSVGLTAAAGMLAAGIGAAAIAEVAQPRLVGALALLSGVALVVSGLIPEELAAAEIGRLIAGAVLIGAAAALLPRQSDVAPAIRL
jgi:hypothetical protein